MITPNTADPEKIQQGVFGERSGYGFDHMTKIAWCRDCEWSITPDELMDDADTIARANSLIGSRAQGHAYFHRGHTITGAYLPFVLHPNPFEEDGER